MYIAYLTNNTLEFITIRFAEEERTLKEEHRRKMEEYIQRKRHSLSASPVGNHKLSSSAGSCNISTNTKARLKQQHNNFVSIPTTSAQVPYSSQPHAQHQYHHHQQQYAGLTPEGENMERKVKQALMTGLTTKSKPSGKPELSLSTRSFQRVDNSRLNPKNTITSQQAYQGSQGSSSISAWPGEDFHWGSNEMTPEPPNIPAANKPDISEFDPIETKNK